MKDKLRRMKANPRDKLIEQSYETCEFNFGPVCAGYGTRTDNGEKTYVNGRGGRYVSARL